MDIKLREVIPEPSVKEKVSMDPRPEKKQKVFRAEVVTPSENIQRFDKKVEEVRNKAASPYDYNSVSLTKKFTTEMTPTATQMITNPLYNTVGKFLGVDTLHEWNQNYDKIKGIVDWAKKKSGGETTEQIVNWLSGALNVVPSLGMNHKKIDQLYLYSRLQGET